VHTGLLALALYCPAHVTARSLPTNLREATQDCGLRLQAELPRWRWLTWTDLWYTVTLLDINQPTRSVDAAESLYQQYLHVL
jgi:hypothetical protein